MKNWIIILLFFSALTGYGQQTKMIQDKQLTKTEVYDLIQEIAGLIESNYVDMTAGPKVINVLNEKITSGEYDRLTTESEFMKVVTNDMREISNDLHLAVRPNQSTNNNSMKRISTDQKQASGNDKSGGFFLSWNALKEDSSRGHCWTETWVSSSLLHCYPRWKYRR